MRASWGQGNLTISIYLYMRRGAGRRGGQTGGSDTLTALGDESSLVLVPVDISVTTVI